MIPVYVKRLLAFAISGPLIILAAVEMGGGWAATPTFYIMLWALLGFATINAPWAMFTVEVVSYILIVAAAFGLSGRHGTEDLLIYATKYALPGIFIGGLGRSTRFLLEDL